jgi:hypothetical protein
MKISLLLVAVLLTGCVQAEAAPASEVDFVKFEEAYPEGILADLDGLTDSPDEVTVPMENFDTQLQTSLILEQNQRCHAGFSFFDGRTIETFEDAEREIKFSFPYSPKWAHSDSSPRYEWLPSTQYPTLRFGPIGTPEGCNLASYYFVSFLPAGSNDSVGSMGMCGPRPTIRLTGSTYDYEFYPLCGDDDEAAVLERIVETVELY